MFPGTNSPLSLVVPMCATVGSDTQNLVKASTFRRIDLLEDALTGWVHARVEGRETEYIRGHFSFVLQ